MILPLLIECGAAGVFGESIWEVGAELLSARFLFMFLKCCSDFVDFTSLLFFTVPGAIGIVSITCGPVNLINQCSVNWDVSQIVSFSNCAHTVYNAVLLFELFFHD